MSTTEKSSRPTLLQELLQEIRPYEIGYFGLLAVAFYYTGAQFRSSPWPVMLFGATVLAGLAMVALRCPAEWRALPNKGFFFMLAGFWVLLFCFLGNSTFGYLDSGSIFRWMFDCYTSPIADAQYGLFIPFVVLGLLWWKCKDLVARPLGLWWPGILLFAAGVFLHLVGYRIQQPKLSLVGFLTGLYGLTGLAWGKNWLKVSFLPLLPLIFSFPATGAADWFTLRLRLLVSWIVAAIAHLGLAPDLIRDGTQLFDAQHTFAYEVAAACSGIHSLMALLALTMVYGLVTFKSPWKRAILMAAAIPLAVLGNVVRLCFTIAVAELFGQDAGKAVETKFGFITFAVAITCTYFISRWLERPQQPGSSSTPALPA